MALDLLQLGQHLGQLDARISALETWAMGQSEPAPATAPAAATEEAEDINIPGLGSMKALFEGQLSQHGGAEGLIAKAFAAATSPPAATPAATTTAPTPAAPTT